VDQSAAGSDLGATANGEKDNEHTSPHRPFHEKQKQSAHCSEQLEGNGKHLKAPGSPMGSNKGRGRGRGRARGRGRGRAAGQHARAAGITSNSAAAQDKAAKNGSQGGKEALPARKRPLPDEAVAGPPVPGRAAGQRRLVLSSSADTASHTSQLGSCAAAAAAAPASARNPGGPHHHQVAASLLKMISVVSRVVAGLAKEEDPRSAVLCPASSEARTEEGAAAQTAVTHSGRQVKRVCYAEDQHPDSTWLGGSKAAPGSHGNEEGPSRGPAGRANKPLHSRQQTAKGKSRLGEGAARAPCTAEAAKPPPAPASPAQHSG
jgi:hypothetical protein